ncbi:MAG: hypothetical protein ABFR95_09585, partial [Actinomycetota bacterium]
FGSIRSEAEQAVIEELLEDGEAFLPAGIRVRQMVFATKPPTRKNYSYLWMNIGDMAEWMQNQVEEHWDKIKMIQSKDPALSFLLLFEKARRGES